MGDESLSGNYRRGRQEYIYGNNWHGTQCGDQPERQTGGGEKFTDYFDV